MAPITIHTSLSKGFNHEKSVADKGGSETCTIFSTISAPAYWLDKATADSTFEGLCLLLDYEDRRGVVKSLERDRVFSKSRTLSLILTRFDTLSLSLSLSRVLFFSRVRALICLFCVYARSLLCARFFSRVLALSVPRASTRTSARCLALSFTLTVNFPRALSFSHPFLLLTPFAPLSLA